VIAVATRRIPVFETEAEEANWWFEHRVELGDELVAAAREGRLGEGSVARYARMLRESGEQNIPRTPEHSDTAATR
jgi:hypothetical protein